MELVLASLTASMQLSIVAIAQPNATEPDCDPAYAEVCIPPAPPDLDCGDIADRRFRVYLPTDADKPEELTDFDPHGFDGDDDGIGCERG